MKGSGRFLTIRGVVEILRGSPMRMGGFLHQWVDMSDIHSRSKRLRRRVVGLLVVMGMIVLVFLGEGRLRWSYGEPSGVGSASATTRPESVSELIGVTALDQALRGKSPIGRGITAGHVEGGVDYSPDVNDPSFFKVKITLRSGEGKASSHATYTARQIYGSRSLSPGIRDVYSYAARDWLGVRGLHGGSPIVPEADGRRVFNHSWILDDPMDGEEVLSRVDYLVDHDDVVMVVGVNNQASSRVPILLASAYNAIAVGVSSGQSSGGYTRFEGSGRCKPDVVAPGQTTSEATAMVTAVVARLLETADRSPRVEVARRSEVIKAVLLAGAEKADSWSTELGKPLNEHLGAGTVRVDRSYEVFVGGPVSREMEGFKPGWDSGSILTGVTCSYSFELARPVHGVSMALVWNRRIDGRVGESLLEGHLRWLRASSMADLDLSVKRLRPDGSAEAVGESVSKIDNVEHVFLRDIEPGRYRMDVVRRDGLGEAWDYALAWWAEEGLR
jgi:hypothetical protein